jgi:hypothetical protein
MISQGVSPASRHDTAVWDQRTPPTDRQRSMAEGSARVHGRAMRFSWFLRQCWAASAKVVVDTVRSQTNCRKIDGDTHV